MPSGWPGSCNPLARFGEDTAEPSMCGIAIVHGMPPQRLGDRDRVEGAGQGPDIPGSTQPRDELGLDQRDAAREKRYRQAGPGQLAQSLPGFAEISAPVLVAVMGRPAGSATGPGSSPTRPRPAGQRNRGHQPQGPADEHSRALGAAGHVFRAADTARRHDPQLARIYYLQMTERGATCLGPLRRRRAPRRTSLDGAAPRHPVRDLRQQRQPRHPRGSRADHRGTLDRARGRPQTTAQPQNGGEGPSGGRNRAAPARRPSPPPIVVTPHSGSQAPHLTPAPAGINPPAGRACQHAPIRTGNNDPRFPSNRLDTPASSIGNQIPEPPPLNVLRTLARTLRAHGRQQPPTLARYPAAQSGITPHAWRTRCAEQRAACPHCSAGRTQPCALPGPGGCDMARFARARREGLITAAEMTAVIKAAGVFTNGTVIRGGGGPRTSAPARMSAELAPWPELNCPAPLPGSSTSADPGYAVANR
jgi:hypothetical protein